MSTCLSFCLSDSVAHMGNQSLGLEHSRHILPTDLYPRTGLYFHFKEMRESMIEINIIKIVHVLLEQWLSDVLDSGCFHVPGCVWLENEPKT